MKPEDFSRLPEHVRQLQELVNRTPTPEGKKTLIVTAGACEAISREEATLLISANMLEEA